MVELVNWYDVSSCAVGSCAVVSVAVVSVSGGWAPAVARPRPVAAAAPRAIAAVRTVRRIGVLLEAGPL